MLANLSANDLTVKRKFKVMQGNGIHKVDELCANCLSYKPDIICIVETWLDHNIANSEIAIPNFALTRLDRDRHGGGIAIYIANYLSFSVVSSGPFDLEFLVISVKHSHGKLGVSLLYTPLSAPNSFFDTFSSSLEHINIPLFSNFFLFFGDVNIDVSTPSPSLTKFCNVINSYNLTLSNTRHTCTTDATATLMLCCLQHHLLQTVVISSHHWVHLTIMESMQVSERAAQRPSQHPRSIWRYDHTDFERANELLSQVHVDSFLREDDITTSWARWEKQFLEIMKQCIP